MPCLVKENNPLLLEATAFGMVCDAAHKKMKHTSLKIINQSPFMFHSFHVSQLILKAIANIGFLITDRIHEAELKLKASLLTLKHVFFPPHLRGWNVWTLWGPHLAPCKSVPLGTTCNILGTHLLPGLCDSPSPKGPGSGDLFKQYLTKVRSHH